MLKYLLEHSDSDGKMSVVSHKVYNLLDTLTAAGEFLVTTLLDALAMRAYLWGSLRRFLGIVAAHRVQFPNAVNFPRSRCVDK
jgi:hypothetical protein